MPKEYKWCANARVYSSRTAAKTNTRQKSQYNVVTCSDSIHEMAIRVHYGRNVAAWPRADISILNTSKLKIVLPYVGRVVAISTNHC